MTEVEANYTYRYFDADVPFGSQNDQWRELKSKMRKGDEIYFVISTFADPQLETHVRVRNDCIVSHLLHNVRVWVEER